MAVFVMHRTQIVAASKVRDTIRMAFLRFTQRPEWNALLEASQDQPVIVFKHSQFCGVSSSIHMMLTEAMEKGELPDIHILTVQDNLELRLIIAEDTDTRHETPQILILKNGKSIYDASHYMISVEEIQDVIK